jgi:predicted DNA-binding transcriptional regulator AlpA
VDQDAPPNCAKGSGVKRQAPSVRRPSPYVRRSELMRLLRIGSRENLARLVSIGAIPRPVPPGDGRWLRGDVDECLQQMPPGGEGP